MTKTNFDELAFELHENSVAKGFYDGYDMTNFKDQACKLMLIDSEVTETMEALRKGKGDRDVLDEISDILIRVLDFYAGVIEAGAVSGSLDGAFYNKVEINKGRPHMHGVRG